MTHSTSPAGEHRRRREARRRKRSLASARRAAPGLLVVACLAAAFGAAGCSRSLSDDEVMERFLEIWTRELGIYADNQWLGVQTLQNPLDAWVTQEVIVEVEPDVIVEAGTWMGGSAPYWAMVLEQLNPEGRVLTIDIEDRAGAARELAIWKRRVDFLLGSSTAPETVAEVRRRVEGKRVLVILDSLHTREHVLEELRLYAPLVPVGSYLIVQDTGLWRPAQGKAGEWASDAVTEFLAETDDFVIDRERERFLITNNPNGYLKRVR